MPDSAPMVQLPAETVEKLREVLDRRDVSAWQGSTVGPVLAAARAAVDAATPAAAVPAADTPREPRCAMTKSDQCLGEIRSVEDPDFVLPWNEAPAPAAPVGEPLPEGWRYIPWTSKEDGVRAPETPASGEVGPPTPPALCVGCGHTKPTHLVTGCTLTSCPCKKYEPRVPVNDEAEAQTAAEVWHKWVLDEEPALPPEWWDITRRAVAAGFRAARGEDA